MKRFLISISLVLASLFIFYSCNKQHEITEEDKERMEYLKAWEIVAEFAQEGSSPKIFYDGKTDIPYTGDVPIPEGDKQYITIHTFTLEKNDVTGFAIATGDPRIATLVAYVENGSLADTTNDFAFKFMITNSVNSLTVDLEKYYTKVETKNPNEYININVGPLCKTNWDTGSPYNNSYDFGNCSGPNQRYKASSSAIACAQAIIANPKRPSAFPGTYDIKRWTEKSKVEETDFYASQVAEFIHMLEGGTNLGCDASYCDLQRTSSMMTYYGYTMNNNYIWNAGSDYVVDLAKTIKDKYCTVIGCYNPQYTDQFVSWVIDGFKGRISKALTQAEMYQVHCNYCMGGQKNGWYKNPFAGLGIDPHFQDRLQLIHFKPF